MMTKDGLIFEANSLKQGRLQALTRQQLQAQATQNRERRWVVPTLPWPLFSRLTPHASRPTLHVPRLTSGVRSCADPPPLATACHRPPIDKDRTGPDLDERPLYFSMSPNQAIFADKSIRFSPLAAAHPLTVLSRPRRSTPVVQACLPDGHQPQCLFSP